MSNKYTDYAISHGRKRMKQRLHVKNNQTGHIMKVLQIGLKASDMDELSEGIPLEEQKMSRDLKNYMSAKEYMHRERSGGSTFVRVFAQNVYVFQQKNQKLITVYSLPKQYIAIADKICGKYRKSILEKEKERKIEEKEKKAKRWGELIKKFV